MPDQSFTTPHAGPRGPLRDGVPWRLRLIVLVPTLVLVAAVVAVFADWFGRNDVMWVEAAILGVVAVTTFGIALSVPLTALGLWHHRRRDVPSSGGRAADVALLVPVFEEDVQAVVRRIAAMRDELVRDGGGHAYAFFVLSDTRCENRAAKERDAVARLRAMRHPVPVFWRRRARNTHRKVGNVRDWVENHGGAFELFITLDADSVLSGGAIRELADALVADPSAGLVQSVPHLTGAVTWFGRAQQFAANVYGGALGAGLAAWSGPDGNYWGHNAAIRTRAFAAACGLPALAGLGPLSGPVKSHDFVEAALLRRAGWRVTILPDLARPTDGSWEETPQTVVDHVLRDRRWCQGNLQHLRILTAPGLTFGSRFHMLQGAMAYLASVLWFALLSLWLLLGTDGGNGVWHYFSEGNPTQPLWPRTERVDRMVVLVGMAVLLLLPKVIGLIRTVLRERRDFGNLARFGGPWRLTANFAMEVLLSVLLAPIAMVQQVGAVLRTIAGLDTGWEPQERGTARHGWLRLMRFHWLETVLGAGLAIAIALGAASLWFVPIAATLLLAVPLSRAVARPAPGLVLVTPEHVRPAPVLRASGARALPAGIRRTRNLPSPRAAQSR